MAQRIPFLNEAWKAITRVGDPVTFARHAAALIQLLLAAYTEREVVLLLGDLVRRLVASAAGSEARGGALQAPESDYLDAALITVLQIHLSEPEGDQDSLEHALLLRVADGDVVIVALRHSDAVPLALLDALGARKGRKYHVTADGLAHLSRHTWPGNIRELGNVLERATILTSAEALTPEVLDLPRGAKAPPSAGPPPVPPALRRDATGADAAAPDLRTLEDVERDHIRSVLRHTDGRLYGAKGAAKLLGMKPTTLQSRMKKLGVERVEELRRD
jgi:hypothetical protein